MSCWTDLRDWLGGYCSEVAKPEAISQFFCGKGLERIKFSSAGRGHGNNEYVFQWRLAVDSGK